MNCRSGPARRGDAVDEGNERAAGGLTVYKKSDDLSGTGSMEAATKARQQVGVLFWITSDEKEALREAEG